MIKNINYANKQAFQNDEDIPENQKVTDQNMNEIKEVVNTNAKELNDVKEKVEVGIKSAFNYKGTVNTYSDLETLTASNGDIYTVSNENKNYIFNGENWIEYNSNFNIDELNNIKEEIASLPIKTYVEHIIVSTEIAANTNYLIHNYTVGNNSLSIFWEGCKLIKEENYIEVDSTHIQFKDWNVPAGSNLEVVVKEA